jgi:hypothetical protein
MAPAVRKNAVTVSTRSGHMPGRPLDAQRPAQGIYSTYVLIANGASPTILEKILKLQKFYLRKQAPGRGMEVSGKAGDKCVQGPEFHPEQ